MLVLTRKYNESVVVGDEDHRQILKVTVIEIRDGRVKLGFDAIDKFPVHRSEVWEEIRTAASGARSLSKERTRQC